MQKWLISSDTQKWDIESYFAKDGFIIWEQFANYEVGDIIYIYAKKPVAKIMFKTVVEEESIYLDDTNQKYVKIRLIKQIDNDKLSLENLKEYGLKIPPMKAYKFNGDLQNYIEEIFDDDFEETIEKIWLIHESEESQKKELFKNFNYVAGDWQVGDLSDLNFEDAKSEFKKAYGVSSNAINNYFLQYDLFVNHIKVGDYIVSSNKSKREYILGKCISDYYFSHNSENQCKHYRDVEWLYSIRWEDISKKARNSIYNGRTVIEIENRFKDELLEFFRYVPFPCDEKRNRIYFGAPGTGKSYKLNQCMDELLDDINDYERVTFHPDYTYGNFVGSYKPISDKDSIRYEYVPGPFMRVLKKALENPSKPYLLIIEEINRANIAAVFGDVFQLLDRDRYDKSEYPIETSEEVKKYLNRNKIRIPSNMFIWATMNSADQGVFPMDTAFKRRWDFEYLNINQNENELKNIKINLNGKEFTWNDIRKAINLELISYGINEDKLMGSFFAFTKLDENLSKDELKKEFKEIFKNKVIMYLFEDVARANRKKLFKGSCEKDYVTYYKICEDFEKKELEIFSKHIKDNLKLGE